MADDNTDNNHAKTAIQKLAEQKKTETHTPSTVAEASAKLAEHHAPLQTSRQESRVVPGAPPQSQMSDEAPQNVGDYTKREIEAGTSANDIWGKRRQAELDLGKKLVSSSKNK